MEEQKFSLGGSFKKTKEYIDSQLELIKLRAVAKGSRILGAFALSIVKVLFVMLIMFFWSLSLGFYLSYLVDSYALGFLITGGIFLLLVIIINLAKKKLQGIIMNITIKSFLGNWHEDDDHIERNREERLKRKAEEIKEKEAVEAINKVKNIVNETDEHK